MAKRKLSPKLKAQLKKKYYAERVGDYEGEAKAYLQKQKKLARARTAKNNRTLKLGDTVIPENSEIYRIVAESAAIKGQTVKKYAKENEAAIKKLAGEGVIHMSREIDNLVDDIASAIIVYITSRSGGKDVATKKATAKYYLVNLKQVMLNRCPIYEKILVEHSYDLKGNLYIKVPLPDEYEEMEDGEDLLEYIDRFYPNISYYRNDGTTPEA